MSKYPEEYCPICRRWVSHLITHHISYSPEKTIRICESCHAKIHRSKNHPLKPKETRTTSKRCEQCAYFWDISDVMGKRSVTGWCIKTHRFVRKKDYTCELFQKKGD